MVHYDLGMSSLEYHDLVTTTRNSASVSLNQKQDKISNRFIFGCEDGKRSQTPLQFR
jgi:hypothetical protein